MPVFGLRPTGTATHGAARRSPHALKCPRNNNYRSSRHNASGRSTAENVPDKRCEENAGVRAQPPAGPLNPDRRNIWEEEKPRSSKVHSCLTAPRVS
jgi:hypothetical protein